MPITQDPNPYFAGYNAHKAAKLELEGIRQENERNSLLMSEYRRKAAAEAEAAPFEAQKRQTEQLLREEKLRQQQMETLQKDAEWTAQNILPPLQAFKKGMMTEEQLMQSVRETVGRGGVDIDPQELEQILAQGPQAIEQVVQASMSVLEQMKPPPRPYSIYQDDQLIQKQWNPETQQAETVGGGRRWNPRPVSGMNIRPPSGYRFNGSDLEPIPGGPRDPAAAAALAKSKAAGQGRVTVAGGVKADAILGAINGIAGMLNQAAEEGDIVTGVVGTAKRFGGGLARQAGVPVSPRAESLSRALERLQAIAGPALLADSRLSDSERSRVEAIVGNIDLFTDDVALRQSLAELATIVQSLDGKQSKPSPRQNEPPAGTPVYVNEAGRKIYFNGTEWVDF